MRVSYLRVSYSFSVFFSLIFYFWFFLIIEVLLWCKMEKYTSKTHIKYQKRNWWSRFLLRVSTFIFFALYTSFSVKGLSSFFPLYTIFNWFYVKWFSTFFSLYNTFKLLLCQTTFVILPLYTYIQLYFSRLNFIFFLDLNDSALLKQTYGTVMSKFTKLDSHCFPTWSFMCKISFFKFLITILCLWFKSQYNTSEFL